MDGSDKAENSGGGAVFHGDITAGRDVTINHFTEIRQIAEDLHKRCGTAEYVSDSLLGRLDVLSGTAEFVEEYAKELQVSTSPNDPQLQRIFSECASILSDLRRLVALIEDNGSSNDEHATGFSTSSLNEEVIDVRSRLIGLQFHLSHIHNKKIGKDVDAIKESVAELMDGPANADDASSIRTFYTASSVPYVERQMWRELERALRTRFTAEFVRDNYALIVATVEETIDPTRVAEESPTQRRRRKSVDSQSSLDPPITKHISQNFTVDGYSGLLLPPGVLPSIEMKVFSARLRPSRLSYLAPNTLKEDEVFTLALYAKSDGKQLWRLEKTTDMLESLDRQVQQFSGYAGKLPDISLFSGHAPAKLDALRAALNTYFGTVLDTPMNEKDALVVCEFFSTDVIGAEDDRPQPTSDLSLRNLDISGQDQRLKKEGYLTKRGKNFGGWKARYFVLDGPVLRYYDTHDGSHLGTIKLTNAQIGTQSRSYTNKPSPRQDDDADSQYRHGLLILEPKRKDSTSLVRHVFCAESDDERDIWVHALLKAVDYQDEHWKGNAKASDKLPSVEEIESSHPSISGPTNDPIVQNAKALRNRLLRYPTAKERRRSIFAGLRERSLSDSVSSQPTEHTNGLTKNDVNQRSLNEAVFGIPLDQAVESMRENGVDTHLPAVVYRCLEYLKAKNASSEEAIFSFNGSSIVTKALRDRFNREGDVNILSGQYNDVHAVASLLKFYLRNLPASILTTELDPEFRKALDLDEEKRASTVNVLIHKLPTVNLELLRALFAFLTDIIINYEVNKMTIKNVSIIFTTTLSLPNKLILIFLRDFNTIFNDMVDEAT